MMTKSSSMASERTKSIPGTANSLFSLASMKCELYINFFLTPKIKFDEDGRGNVTPGRSFWLHCPQIPYGCRSYSCNLLTLQLIDGAHTCQSRHLLLFYGTSKKTKSNTIEKHSEEGRPPLHHPDAKTPRPTVAPPRIAQARAACALATHNSWKAQSLAKYNKRKKTKTKNPKTNY